MRDPACSHSDQMRQVHVDEASHWTSLLGPAPAALVADLCPEVADTARDAASRVLGGCSHVAATVAVALGPDHGAIYSLSAEIDVPVPPSAAATASPPLSADVTPSRVLASHSPSHTLLRVQTVRSAPSAANFPMPYMDVIDLQRRSCRRIFLTEETGSS